MLNENKTVGILSNSIFTPQYIDLQEQLDHFLLLYVEPKAE